MLTVMSTKASQFKCMFGEFRDVIDPFLVKRDEELSSPPIVILEVCGDLCLLDCIE